MLHEPIVFTNAKEGVEVGVALQWCADAFSDTMMGFANSIKTIDGGSHMDGLKTALTKLINNMARKNKVKQTAALLLLLHAAVSVLGLHLYAVTCVQGFDGVSPVASLIASCLSAVAGNSKVMMLCFSVPYLGIVMVATLTCSVGHTSRLHNPLVNHTC